MSVWSVVTGISSSRMDASSVVLPAFVSEQIPMYRCGMPCCSVHSRIACEKSPIEGTRYRTLPPIPAMFFSDSECREGFARAARHNQFATV